MGRVRRSLRAAFHRKHPGECMPAAPLRALGYTSAGGCFATIGKTPGGSFRSAFGTLSAFGGLAGTVSP